MKKWNVVSVVGAILSVISSVAYAGPLADSTADSLWGIQLGGYLDVSYTYDFNNPDKSDDGIGGVGHSGDWGDRVFAADNNEVQLDAFQLYIDKLPTDVGEAGFRFDILAGEDAEWIGDLFGGYTNDISIYQAYVSYIAPIGNGLTVDVGRFVGSAGYESIESPLNDQFTRSMVFLLLHPWTTVGVRATYAFNEFWEIMGGLTQGWDVVDDNNEAWTFNGAIRWMPTESAFLQYAAYYGPENWNVNGPIFGINRLGNNMYRKAVSNSDYSWLNDVVLKWDINETWTVGGNFDYLTTENAIGTQDADVWSMAAYLRVNVNESLYLALRGEYIDDQDGLFYYNPAWKDNSLWEVTATLGYTLTEGLMTRLEYRHDQSDRDIFVDKGQSAAGFANADDQQDTVSIELIYCF